MNADRITKIHPANTLGRVEKMKSFSQRSEEFHA